MELQLFALIVSAIAATTSVIAVSVSSWAAVRIARATRPVEWHFNIKEDRHQQQGIVDISCTGADAVGFMIEVHQHPFFTRSFETAFEVGQIWRVTVPVDRRDDSWVVLGWSHPADRNHPIRAWFPLYANGLAAVEMRRQQTTWLPLTWFRMHILQSHVRPGRFGIPGRKGGSRDRRIVGGDLRRQKIKPWEQRLTPWGDPGRRLGKEKTGSGF